jgi:uncharacterized protein YndB with AHSA1/START domain
MMGIVHDALRRDLARAIEALSAAPTSRPPGNRRTALGEQVLWMMAFLHAHHRGEDAWLWPLVRERAPHAAPLLDAMQADHALVDPLIDSCERAAQRYLDGCADAEREALAQALIRLRDALLPHLRREQDEVMPIASVAITDAEWHAIDQEHFVKPKSMTDLAREGHWLLDGLDAERREVLLRQVPVVPRFLLLHGFARRYRRRATACWGPPKAEDRPHGTAYGPAAALPRTVPRTGRVEAVVDAPVEAVWSVVSDVTRTSEWSHECRHVEWLTDAHEPAQGARFRGTNKAGPWTWRRTSEILTVDPPRKLAWRTIPTLRYRDSTEWQIALHALDGRTRIIQSYHVLRASRVFGRLYATLIASHRGRGTELTEDLRRLGELAATPTPAAQAPPAPGPETKPLSR